MTRVRLVAGADARGAAYADADWLGPSGEPAAALVVDGDGDGERAAALVLLDLASRAAAEVAGAARVEVVGSGFVAGAVSALVGAGGDGPLAAIVDTSGDPERIRAALGRLDDLGTLVLAGEPLGRPLELDLYPDVHVRGLRMVGVPLRTEVPREADLPAAAVELLNRPAAGLHRAA